MFRIIGLCCLSICFLSGEFAAADNETATVKVADDRPKVKVGDNVIVVTNDGRVTVGELVKDTKESITLNLKGGGTREIQCKTIEEIHKVKTAVPEAEAVEIKSRR
jgi:hypothetical protein